MRIDRFSLLFDCCFGRIIYAAADVNGLSLNVLRGDLFVVADAKKWRCSQKRNADYFKVIKERKFDIMAVIRSGGGVVMKITIRKIAELSGVSRGAVDKVIHNRPGVKESVRQRVLQVIEETGYTPLHSKAEKPQTIKTAAVIIPRLNNPYFFALKQGMEQACSTLPDLSLEYYHCDTTDVHGILAILKFLEEREIDLYIMRGVRSERVKDCLNQSGKPVVFVDSLVPGAKGLCLVGEDCYKSGRIAASLLAKSIHKKGEIAVIGGSMEVSGHKLRIEGFRDVIHTAYPQIKIVEEIYSQDQSVIAYERTKRVLEQYPKLSGLCNLAGCAGDVGRAIIDRNRQDSVKLICYNATEDVLNLIQRGIVDFAISLSPQRQGQLLVATAYDYLRHEKQPDSSFLRTPVTLVMDENIDLFLEEEEI